jgi:hypothetical protein
MSSFDDRISVGQSWSTSLASSWFLEFNHTCSPGLPFKMDMNWSKSNFRLKPNHHIYSIHHIYIFIYIYHISYIHHILLGDITSSPWSHHFSTGLGAQEIAPILSCGLEEPGFSQKKVGTKCGFHVSLTFYIGSIDKPKNSSMMLGQSPSTFYGYHRRSGDYQW